LSWKPQTGVTVGSIWRYSPTFTRDNQDWRVIVTTFEDGIVGFSGYKLHGVILPESYRVHFSRLLKQFLTCYERVNE
jgi:hypothetical protein